MEKILDIVDAIAGQKGLDTQSVHAVVKQAYINTAKRILGSHLHFDAQLDEESRTYRLFRMIEVVADDNERLSGDEDDGAIGVADALKLDSEAEIGDEIKEEISLAAFGRTAAMSLHSELERSLQKLTEDAVYDNYKSKLGKLISGVVTRIDGDENTYIEMGEVRAVLPRKSRIKDERFRVGDTVKTIVRHVTMNMKDGIKIELSRTTPKFLEELLRLEVPEIADSSITIERCARIPGKRAKVALSSQRPHIDPVGATIGTKGIRINAVSRELKDENIDVISYDETPELFIARAMSPAAALGVTIDGKRAIVQISGDQKAKAIGKDGINIRLASMLTGYEIELQENGGGANGEESDGTSLLSALFNS
ncbi:transcription termination/antitermination protein NusA [Campylobacterota bacterium]|nr:transcription termination/antitermination protein NusA [Campylobacterota bacterium]